MHAMHLLCSVAIQPTLELKTQPKQLLGSLLLDIALPGLVLIIMDEICFKTGGFYDASWTVVDYRLDVAARASVTHKYTIDLMDMKRYFNATLWCRCYKTFYGRKLRLILIS
jgi:hypothetical protein